MGYLEEAPPPTTLFAEQLVFLGVVFFQIQVAGDQNQQMRRPLPVVERVFADNESSAVVVDIDDHHLSLRFAANDLVESGFHEARVSFSAEVRVRVRRVIPGEERGYCGRFGQFAIVRVELHPVFVTLLAIFNIGLSALFCQFRVVETGQV